MNSVGTTDNVTSRAIGDAACATAMRSIDTIISRNGAAIGDAARSTHIFKGNTSTTGSDLAAVNDGTGDGAVVSD